MMKYFRLIIWIVLVAVLILNSSPLSAEEKSKLGIFSDSNYQNTTTQFVPNQKVYTKIKSNNLATIKRQLRLLDNNYQQISNFTLKRINDSYLLDFNAPNDNGIYSLEATLQSNGKVEKYVRTITVGKSNNYSVKINTSTSSNGVRIESNNEQKYVSSRDPPSKSELKNDNNINTDLEENKDVIYPSQLKPIKKTEKSIAQKLINMVTQSIRNFITQFF